MFIQVKTHGGIASVLCREAIVRVDRRETQTYIWLLGQNEGPLIYKQTYADFKHLVKQLTSEL